jgi:hypothetical protein
MTLHSLAAPEKPAKDHAGGNEEEIGQDHTTADFMLRSLAKVAKTALLIAEADVIELEFRTVLYRQ